MLTSVTVGDAATVNYVYNAFGERVKMTVASQSPQSRWFDYDGGTLIAERDGSGLTRSYLNGRGVIWDDDGTNVSIHHSDAHGSTTELTDDAGDFAARQVYDAWGNTADTTNDGVGRLGYGGEVGYKSDTYGDLSPTTGGIMQCGVRYYDPDIGRFLQMDSLVGFAGASPTLNRYVYCLNDPINGSDPFGLQSSNLLGGWAKIGEGSAVVIGSTGAFWGIVIVTGPPGWVIGGLFAITVCAVMYGGWTIGDGINDVSGNNNGNYTPTPGLPAAPPPEGDDYDPGDTAITNPDYGEDVIGPACPYRGYPYVPPPNER